MQKILEVPYYEQEFPWSCFPACVRMILDYYGVKQNEKELRILFKTTPLHGTYWNFVKDGLKKFGFEFYYMKDGNIENLFDLIEKGMPPIISIDAKLLGSSEHVNHIVVVVGIEKESVNIQDPEIGRITLSIADFLEAWSIRERRIGYIKRFEK